jgi:hypothetical protein
VGIENAVFHRRLQRKMRSKDARLAELYSRTCTVCGVPAHAETGVCGTCGRQVFQVERDPIPPGAQIPVDEEKAAALKAFYQRLNDQRAEREKPKPQRDVERLPGESLPGEPAKRDWRLALNALGMTRRW